MAPALVTTDLIARAARSQGGGIYRIIPAAVAGPATVAELREVLAHARAHDQSVTCRGAGSAMDGSNLGRGMVIDMCGFERGRCAVDAASCRATLSPSLALAVLNAAAQPYGLRLPVDPSSAAWATLGGMTSTNASGARTVQVGSIRRWIDGVTLETVDGPLALRRGVAPDGAHPAVRRWRMTAEPLLHKHGDAIRQRFPHVRKNSAGYALDHYLDSGDLLDIVIGAEGTLGVITDVLVRLQPIPAHRMSLRVAVARRSELPDIIERLRAFDPATLELLDQSFLRLVADQVTVDRRSVSPLAAGLLLMDLEGNDRVALADTAIRAAAAIAADVLDVRVATDATDIAVLWDIRHRASPILAGLRDGRRSLQVIEDGCVPVPRLAEYLDAVDAAARAERIDVVMFGHAGDGHVHVNLLPNLHDDDWLPRVRTIYDGVSRAVIALGGTPSGEHGAGRLRANLMEELYGPQILECFRAVRSAFDPAGQFDGGVIIDDGSDPFSRLKVGAGAAPLPPSVVAALERREIEARWGRPLEVGIG
jgi:FAD/FMN-containing dehydrogenase